MLSYEPVTEELIFKVYVIVWPQASIMLLCLSCGPWFITADRSSRANFNINFELTSSLGKYCYENNIIVVQLFVRTLCAPQLNSSGVRSLTVITWLLHSVVDETRFMELSNYVPILSKIVTRVLNKIYLVEFCSFPLYLCPGLFITFALISVFYYYKIILNAFRYKSLETKWRSSMQVHTIRYDYP